MHFGADRSSTTGTAAVISFAVGIIVLFFVGLGKEDEQK
jgi:uncharacterized membrane protein YdcZ (DUF606 family)